MLRRKFCVALIATCAATVGCASDEPAKKDDPMNDLWKQGYGYNNPNNERRKQGLPPLNFDGTPSKK